jgi:hypothetical protein
MRNPSRTIRSWIAGLVVILLSVPFEPIAVAAPAQNSPAPATQGTPAQPQGASDPQDRPRDPTGETGKKTPTAPDPSAANSEISPELPSQSGGQDPQQNEPAKPVGTAAAPYEKTTGVAASRPAGAVIAPAKQRRVRTFLIRMGIVIGAGVAVGTVAALSHASPSRPQ